MRVVIAEFMDQAAVNLLANHHPTHYDPELVDRRDELNARPTVAEYVIGVAMLLLRGAYLSTEDVGAGKWPRVALLQRRELAGKTLGVVGFGQVGRLTARMARCLAMRVIGFDAQIKSGDAVRLRSPRGRIRPPKRTGACLATDSTN